MLTVWVDDREQIEVVLVNPTLGLRVGGIVGQKTVRVVFNSLRPPVSLDLLSNYLCSTLVWYLLGSQSILVREQCP